MKPIRILTFVLTILVLTATVSAQVTALRINSDSGDWIGQGQSISLTPADGSFSAYGMMGSPSADVSFAGQAGEFWSLRFAAPSGRALTVGIYSGAVRLYQQTLDQPGMDISGEGRICTTLTGSFTVLEISYGIDEYITSFDAIFEQYCDGSTAALRGEIRYNAHLGVAVIAPSHLTVVENNNLSFDVTAIDSESRHVVLTATGLPAGASFLDNGNNTGTFSWTPVAGTAGAYFVTFRGDNLAGDIGGATTQLVVVSPPPPNDDFNQPTVITGIPFTVTQDASTATVAPDDPFCYSRNQTVWFSFTPTQNVRLEANTFGSNYDTALCVYTGVRGWLNQIGYNDDSGGTSQSRVRFDAAAGTTYYFMVSAFYPAGPANLVFNVIEGPPAFSFAPGVAQFGSVDPATGAATLSGFATCSQPAYVYINGEVKQVRERYSDQRLLLDRGSVRRDNRLERSHSKFDYAAVSWASRRSILWRQGRCVRHRIRIRS